MNAKTILHILGLLYQDHLELQMDTQIVYNVKCCILSIRHTLALMPPAFLLLGVLPWLQVLSTSTRESVLCLSQDWTISRDGFPLTLTGVSNEDERSSDIDNWILSIWTDVGLHRRYKMVGPTLYWNLSMNLSTILINSVPIPLCCCLCVYWLNKRNAALTAKLNLSLFILNFELYHSKSSYGMVIIKLELMWSSASYLMAKQQRGTCTMLPAHVFLHCHWWMLWTQKTSSWLGSGFEMKIRLTVSVNQLYVLQ